MTFDIKAILKTINKIRKILYGKRKTGKKWVRNL